MTGPAGATAVPVIALVARPGEGEPLRPLVRAIARRVAVRAAHRAGPEGPAAVLATSPQALALLDGWDGPTAVWIGGHDQLEAFRDLPASVPHTVITPVAEAAAAARAGGAGVVEVATSLGDIPDVTPLPPLLRRRWRERLGLPARLVVVVDRPEVAAERPADPGDHPVTATVRAVSLDDPGAVDLVRFAGAVVAGPGALALAMVAGAPTVCAARDALDAGLRPGHEVQVPPGGPAEATRVAAALLDDDHAATQLSNRASAWARAASVDRAADAVLGALGLGAAAADQWDRVLATLSRLDLPAGGPLRRRVLDAFSPFLEPQGDRIP